MGSVSCDSETVALNDQIYISYKSQYHRNLGLYVETNKVLGL